MCLVKLYFHSGTAHNFRLSESGDEALYSHFKKKLQFFSFTLDFKGLVMESDIYLNYGNFLHSLSRTLTMNCSSCSA